MNSYTTKQLGNHGESAVVDYLKQQGFTILVQNYRKFFGEIDIIAYQHHLYVFVEVKTRKSNSIPLAQLISPSKQRKIIKTAQTFITEQQLINKVFRFDVALLTLQGTAFSIEYIENAFTQSESLRRYDY